MEPGFETSVRSLLLPPDRADAAARGWVGQRCIRRWRPSRLNRAKPKSLAGMRMPGMTGVELYQALVASGHAIPTVIITAHPEEITNAREAGITCYLTKPFAPDELLECVSEALAKSQTPRPIPKS